MSAPLNAVTGSFGYTGKYIARELVARGARVRTLTRPHPERPNPFGAQIETAPLDFANFDELVRVRFSHGRATFDSAVVAVDLRTGGVEDQVVLAFAGADTRLPGRADQCLRVLEALVRETSPV